MAADAFERTASRLTRTMEICAVAGIAVGMAWRGWRGGLGFALGAAVAWLNFRWLKGFVAGMGPGGRPSVFMALFALRYLLLIAGVYVIFRFSKPVLPGALAGLFTPLAAALIEVLIQLRYARRDLDH
jgi:hypothetical protein